MNADQAFGQPTHAVWPELQHFTTPIYSAVLTGQVRTFSEQRFVLQRNHRDTEIWLDLTYSPIRDERGRVAASGMRPILETPVTHGRKRGG